jgi:hypothetical protein
MRELLTSLLLASCLLPVGAFGLTIASGLFEKAISAPFANLQSEAVWTSEVRRIDASKQAFERLPPDDAANTMVAEAKPRQRVSPMMMGTSRTDTSINQNPVSDVDTAQPHSNVAQEWCSSRYRSYDPNDNTYQPYGGGSRRVCSAPIDAIIASTEQLASARVVTPDSVNARWCMARYSSYRIEDNTYQPYSGRRKQCAGPGSQSASNDAQSVGGNSVVRF